ncbi:MAG TPA: phosphoenolpyruvate-utilizing N-terminal domain-containing protein [Anaeromyxobacteraceae bacterium]|nr:phosphoenolpyruvate-utilizing N-terminal domain-containing protein [Anaeromyxobacteraceae bacterium]
MALARRPASRSAPPSISRAAASWILETSLCVFSIAVIASHLLLLKDPTLLEHIDQQIGRGVSARLAIDAALGEFESRLGLVRDPYISEKIDDVDDLRTRLLDHVLGDGSRARLGAGVSTASSTTCRGRRTSVPSARTT